MFIYFSPIKQIPSFIIVRVFGSMAVRSVTSDRCSTSLGQTTASLTTALTSFSSSCESDRTASEWSNQPPSTAGRSVAVRGQSEVIRGQHRSLTYSLRLLPEGCGDGTSNNVGPPAATIDGDVFVATSNLVPSCLRSLARTSPARMRGAPRDLDHPSAIRLKV